MSKYREMTHEEVLAECKKYMNDEHLAFVESAYEFAKKLMQVNLECLVSLILFTLLKLQEL